MPGIKPSNQKEGKYTKDVVDQIESIYIVSYAYPFDDPEWEK
jgi:hypothetical protein